MQEAERLHCRCPPDDGLCSSCAGHDVLYVLQGCINPVTAPLFLLFLPYSSLFGVFQVASCIWRPNHTSKMLFSLLGCSGCHDLPMLCFCCLDSRNTRLCPVQPYFFCLCGMTIFKETRSQLCAGFESTINFYGVALPK